MIESYRKVNNKDNTLLRILDNKHELLLQNGIYMNSRINELTNLMDECDVDEKSNGESPNNQTLNLEITRERLRTLGEMCAGIIHEINQPLSGIRLSLESSLRHHEQPKPDLQLMKKNLLIVKGLTDRIDQIVNRVRHFSHQSDSSVESLVDLNSALNNSCDVLEQQLKTHDINLNIL